MSAENVNYDEVLFWVIFYSVLDLDQHLKNPKDAIDAIWQGLNDSYVQEARLFSLCQRITKLSTMKKKSALLPLKEKKKFFDHHRWLAPQEPKTLTIQGKVCYCFTE